jgi:aliphatic nitrilase
MAIADLDFSLITKRKRMMDCVGHYARPDLLQLQLNPSQWAVASGLQTKDELTEAIPSTIALPQPEFLTLEP